MPDEIIPDYFHLSGAMLAPGSVFKSQTVLAERLAVRLGLVDGGLLVWICVAFYAHKFKSGLLVILALV
ncbi:MAG TPA: hypothetical protein VN831_09300 [Bradyrhizobium sp.]|jgi:hypothetical protein|nr:hypothetical protein [Bradyrhizobium sp.]